MAQSPAQNLPPAAESRVRNRQNVFYPQTRVVLSVVFENFGDPEAPKTFNVFPRAVTVYSNSYKEADTWSVEFNAEDLPVSPELIRAGAAEIYLFQTRGVGQLPEVIKGKDDLPEGTFEGLEPTIAGLFDEVQLEYSDGGKTITIDGQDYTALFIAKQWPDKRRAPAGMRLDRAIRHLMAQVPGAAALRLTTIIPEGAKLPIVGRSAGRTNKKGAPVRGEQNYWDVMYKMAVTHGFILFVRNLEVVLTTPQAFIAGKTKVRKMLWGRNLQSLRMSRRIGKEQVPIIEVRSYDDKTRQVLKARYPRNRKQKPVTGLGTDRDEIRIFTLPGIRSAEQLALIAETYYNLKARAEQIVEIETMDLRDLEGSNLVELRAGDALSVGFDPYNSQSVLLEGQSAAQRVATLIGFGYPQHVAQEIARGFDRINLFKRPFRVREATLEWSHDGGLHISAELQNYVNIQGQAP